MSWESYYIILLVVAILLLIIAVIRLYIWCSAVDRADRAAAERARLVPHVQQYPRYAPLAPQYAAPQYAAPPPQYAAAQQVASS